ncbi:MAG: shikimate kinase AroK [Pseudomonadota bacterium]
MKTPRNIFLVGPMGAGKSAVGRQLARATHLNFVDSDDVIEERTGVDIAFIFEKEGEDGFRSREAKIIDELTGRDGIVLATGGGAVIRPENRHCLGGRGFVVYLYTSVDQQVRRTAKGRERPLRGKTDPEKTLAGLLEVRDPLYREIADLVVETDNRKVHSVASEIIEQIS